MTTSTREPSVIDMLAQTQRHLQGRVRTIVPAVVVSYNPASLSCAVQPAPMMRLPDGTPQPVSQLTDCPVAFPMTGQFAITWPLHPGDGVLLLCADREIDSWRRGGAVYPPKNGRMHSITDAIVWPGAGPAPDPVVGASPTDLVVLGPTGPTLRITPLGTVQIAEGLTSAPVARSGDPVAVTSAALLTLQQALEAWVPAPNDGGAALKTALATFLGLSETAVVAGTGTITAGSAKVTAG